MRDWPWGLIFTILAIVAAVAALIGWIAYTEEQFNKDCTAAGGRVISVQGSQKVCVTEDWKYIPIK